MHLSERIAVIHLSAILAMEDLWEIGFGTSANTLAGLAALLDPSGTTRALAAGAAFSGATRDLIRSEVYAKSFATAIVRACDDERKDYRLLLESRMRRPLDEYPIDLAMVDIAEYHKRGSFWHGLSVVIERANTTDDLAALKTEAERNALILNASLKRIELGVSLERVMGSMDNSRRIALRDEFDELTGDSYAMLSRSMTVQGLKEYIALLDAFAAKLDGMNANQ
jgi:hypothetical protein